jgi:hypothetical protein
MKSFLAGAALAAVIVVLIVSVSSMKSAQAADVCPANPSPPDAADPSMIVDTPADGATVTSPVIISGRARVFEAHVSITVYDAAGNVLVDTFTMSAEAAPALAAFSANVPFAVSTLQQGCIRVWEESAQDGSPRNVVQVEVNLAPPTTPPQTGSGGLQSDGGNEKHLALYAAGLLAILGAAALAIERRLWT